MLIKFEQPIGPVGDVNELEYISALHQSDKTEIRRDASIRAEDIRSFLASRYGIVVTDSEVQQTILHGLGGGDGDQEVLDLMELVACLQIPVLLKAAQQHKTLPKGMIPAPDKLLEYALKIILHDVTGDSKPKRLTPELLRNILSSYGEHELAEDNELLNEMIDAAKNTPGTTTSPLLTVDNFSHGLTKDIELYDLRNEVRPATNLDDVFLDETEQEAAFQDRIAAAAEHEVRQSTRTGGNDVEDSSTFVSIADHVKDANTVRVKLKRVNTLPQIDPIAGTFRSKALMVCLWTTFLITYFTRVLEFFETDVGRFCGDREYRYSYTAPWIDNRKAILCEAGASVIFWLVFFVGMMLVGTTFLLLGSTGNSIDCRKWWMPLIGAFVVAVAVIVPYRLIPRSQRFRDAAPYLDATSLGLGFITICFHLGHTCTLLAPKFAIFEKCLPPTWFARNSVLAERELKRVAAIKLSNMARNGLDMVRAGETDELLATYYGRALQSFSKAGRKIVEAGGFVWTWKRLLSGKVYHKDGILIPGRMVAANISQYIIAICIIYVGRSVVRTAGEGYDSGKYLDTVHNIVEKTANRQADEQLITNVVGDVTTLVSSFLTAEGQTVDFGCDNVATTTESILQLYCSTESGSLVCQPEGSINYLCPLLEDSDLDAATQLAFLSGAGFDQATLEDTTRFALQQATDDALNSMFPSQKYMVVVPVAAATIFAAITALYLAVTYIPSTVTTILRMRSGAIDTLRDPRFYLYRKAPDQVAILTGSVFWGCFVSSIVVGSVFGLFIFFFLWQATAYYAQRLTATVIGMLGIFLVRMVTIRSSRKSLYRVFYRQQPGKANILVLAMEWASFSLSAGYILSRFIKLALATFSCIGRVDTQFLAPGVGRLGPVELDNYPMVHRKDLLTHEAHRHPYIEMLGVIYLMKMRYGDNFGHRAGSCWRLLYVHALMPWLHKYRVQARPALMGDVDGATLDFNDNPVTFVSLSSRGLGKSTKNGVSPEQPSPKLAGFVNRAMFVRKQKNLESATAVHHGNFLDKSDTAIVSHPQSNDEQDEKELLKQAEREAYAYMRIQELEVENLRLKKQLEVAKMS